jgi:predicted nucleotidyltransferase
VTDRTAELIMRAREDVGMTQAQLAHAAGMQQPTISAYESGAKRPRPETLRRITQAARLRPSTPLSLYRDDIRLIAEAHHLRRLRVFGSAARGDDTELSDIDLLVATDLDTTLFDLARFVDLVSSLTGFDVDVLTDQQVAAGQLAHVAEEAVLL